MNFHCIYYDMFSTNFICAFVFLLLQIWIQPEHPKQPTAIFGNLTNVTLSFIYPECDLSWTLFILEAAPALQMFIVSLSPYLLVV
jgi:hypothetical protein